MGIVHKEDIEKAALGSEDVSIDDMEFLETLARGRCVLLPPWVYHIREDGQLEKLTPVKYDEQYNLDKARILLAVMDRLGPKSNLAKAKHENLVSNDSPESAEATDGATEPEKLKPTPSTHKPSRSDAEMMYAWSIGVTAASESTIADSTGQLVDRLLDGFQLTQIQLATKLLQCSPRSLSLWKAGNSPNPGTATRLRELERLYQELAALMPREEIGPWMKRTNDYLNPLTPLEVLARGEIDRLWHIIHNVGSGMPT